MLWKKLARFAIVGAVLATLAVAVSECDEVPDSGGSGAKQPTTRAIVQPGNGVVRGVVKFAAPKPDRKVIGGDCCAGSPPVMDETTVVNDDGTLRNVVVYLKDGPNIAAENDAAVAVLDQKDCRYVPHVLAVRTNEPVDVTSHDPTMHNVHVLASANRAENFSETAVGASRRLTFAAPEFIRVKCDVHPWMGATIAVFDHPCFAVTGDGGEFQIPRLPAGAYTLVAWHERYGTIEKQIQISGETPVDVQFEYAGP